MSTFRKRIKEAVEARRLEEIEGLASEDPRAIRHLVSLTYQEDAELRGAAIRGLVRASKVHPKRIRDVVRRLVNDLQDSASHAAHAPAVLLGVAEESPELLLPVVNDLMRLVAMPETRSPELSATLKRIAEGCPGQVGTKLSKVLERPNE